MKVDLPTALKLATFTGVAALAAAATHFGVPRGEHVLGWLGTALELGKEGAMALTGHLGVQLLDTSIDASANAEERARGAQNHDLHRLIGEAIARILEREAAGAPGGEFGAKYLIQAAAAFRTEWMTVKLTGAEAAVSEPAIPSYFVGDAESIRKAPVLEQAEWISLVEKVAGPATFREYDEALSRRGQAPRTFRFRTVGSRQGRVEGEWARLAGADSAAAESVTGQHQRGSGQLRGHHRPTQRAPRGGQGAERSDRKRCHQSSRQHTPPGD